MELQAEPFLLHDVVRRQSKDGRPFLLATLRDRTGQIGGVFWDVPLTVDAGSNRGWRCCSSGRVSLYKDAIQVNINDLARAAGLDLAVFLPASRRPQAEMLAELRDDVTALAEPWQTLAGYLLLEGELAERFANAPAARSMHHAFVGGLLEHTLSMATVARFCRATIRTLTATCCCAACCSMIWAKRMSTRWRMGSPTPRTAVWSATSCAVSCSSSRPRANSIFPRAFAAARPSHRLAPWHDRMGIARRAQDAGGRAVAPD